jgi:RimJ/RimL family protein N-acetyltransferase
VTGGRDGEHIDPPRLTTERLLLRGFADADVEPLADMNGDPEVMRFLGGTRTREWSAATINRCREQWDQLGFGRLAIEAAETHEFVGWVTLEPVERAAYADDVEIGWRLARAHWGLGYATEAARGVLDWAFATLPVDRVLALADPANDASVAVMRRLGMTRLPDLEDDEGRSTVCVLDRHESPSRPD